MLRNRLILRSYLFRGAQLWLITRMLLTGVFLLAGTNPLEVSSSAGVEIILLSVALGFLETRRRRESVFLANLGVRPLMLGAWFASPAVIGEIAVHLGGIGLR